MLNSCGDFVVDNSLVIFSDNIDTQLQDVLSTDFMWFALPVLWGETRAIDKGTVGRLDVANVDSARSLLGPDFGVLTRENFGIKVTVGRCWNGFSVRLTADTEDVWIEG